MLMQENNKELRHLKASGRRSETYADKEPDQDTQSAWPLGDYGRK